MGAWKHALCLRLPDGLCSITFSSHVQMHKVQTRIRGAGAKKRLGRTNISCIERYAQELAEAAAAVRGKCGKKALNGAAVRSTGVLPHRFFVFLHLAFPSYLLPSSLRCFLLSLTAAFPLSFFVHSLSFFGRFNSSSKHGECAQIRVDERKRECT